MPILLPDAFKWSRNYELRLPVHLRLCEKEGCYVGPRRRCTVLNMSEMTYEVDPKILKQVLL